MTSEQIQSPMTSVAIRELTVLFNNHPACREVDLEIPAGGVTVIVGRSGSGKTTLLRALNRLNECFPGCRTRGRVTLDFPGASDVEAYDARTDVELLRRRVGMVFQSPNVLPVSIGRNLLLPLKLVAGSTGNEAEARMEQALRSVGLWDEVAERLQHPAATLSGGQQQRLCLARALALEPELLLLDEPTASVDYRSAEIIEKLLRELSQRLTVVMVSHSLSQTRRLGHQVVLMRDGSLAGLWCKDQDKSANEPDALETLDVLLEEAF